MNFNNAMHREYSITLDREVLRVVHTRGIFDVCGFGELAEPHSHAHCELFLNVKGCLSVLVDGTPYMIEPGDLRVYASGEIHSGKTDETQEMEWYQISIPIGAFYELPEGKRLSRCFLARKAGKKNRTHPDSFDKMVSLLAESFETEDGDSLTNVLRYSLVLQTLCLVSRAYEETVQEDGGNMLLPTALTAALALIGTDFRRLRTVGDIANEAHVSVSYLGYLFRTYLGCTPYAYLVGKKTEEAKKRLAEGCSVTEACDLCGFSDYSNFITLFKRKTGKSPLRYARENLQKAD